MAITDSNVQNVIIITEYSLLLTELMYAMIAEQETAVRPELY